MALPAGFQLEQATPSANAALPAGFQLEARGSEIPATRRSWSDTFGEAISNLPTSAGKFGREMYEAVTSPVQTATNILDIGAGALQNITPKVIKDIVDRFDTNPDAAKRAVATANAFGGEYAKRYGTMDGFKEALATDPVSVISDFSALASGGASAVGRVAPTTAKVLATTAKYTNPAAPLVAAAEYGIGMGAKAAGNVVDVMQGQRAAVKAGNIVRNALTEQGRAPQNLLAAQAAIQNAAPGTTVRQALSDVTAPQVQFLGEMMDARAPGAALKAQQAREAARRATLQSITPDEAAAITARKTVSDPLYTAAAAPTTPITTAPLVQNIDALMAANPGNVKLVSALNQVKSGLEASTTAQQVSSVLDNLKDLISSKDNKFIVSNLIDVKNDIIKAVPGYKIAQQTFAAMSPPVNQARVLGAMQDVLTQPLGVGERAAPFMTAMGRGEQALLKKSTGFARYSELSDVLTPSQMQVVGEIKSDLMRDANIAKQAKVGVEAMKTILETNKSKFRAPGFMSVKVTLANEMLSVLEGRLNKKVMAELEKGFQSGTNFSDLMKKIPASERIEVLRVLGDVQGKLSPNKLNVYTQTQNALASEDVTQQNNLPRFSRQD
jgi:hypothetical protein